MPPSTSAASCSANQARCASSGVIAPSGASSSPRRAEVPGDQQAALVGHRPGDPARRSGFTSASSVAEAVHVQPRAGAVRRCWWSGSGRPASAVRRVRRRGSRPGSRGRPALGRGRRLSRPRSWSQGAHAAVEEDRPVTAQQRARGGSSARARRGSRRSARRATLGLELGGDAVEHLGTARRPPPSTACGPSPRGSRRHRCPPSRIARPRRWPPGTAATSCAFTVSLARVAPPPSRACGRASGVSLVLRAARPESVMGRLPHGARNGVRGLDHPSTPDDVIAILSLTGVSAVLLRPTRCCSSRHPDRPGSP